MKWLTSKEFRQMFKLSSQSLYMWARTGRVKTKRINRKLFYLAEDNTDAKQLTVIYCRVSNAKQSEDLIRQERVLREYCVINGLAPDAVIKDIASGMNDNRKGIDELINLVISDTVGKVVISYKDRLTRFGFDHYKNLFLKYNTVIDVVNLTAEEDFQTELTEDLISIIHHFSMKMYSNRKKQLKALRVELEKKDDESNL